MDWQAILAVVLPLIAAATPLVRKYIQAHVTPDQLGHVRDIARMAVRAAEQLGNDLNRLDPEEYAAAETWAAAKATYAERVIADGAKRLGVKLSADEVDAFLHSALREMKQLDVA